MTAMERKSGAISERLSISFRLDDPQQALIYQYLKDLRNGQRAVVIARFLPPGITAYQNSLREKRSMAAPAPRPAKRSETEPVEALEPLNPAEYSPEPVTTDLSDQAAVLGEQPHPSYETTTEEDAFLMDAITRFTQQYEGNG